jgi:hypothetical protein
MLDGADAGLRIIRVNEGRGEPAIRYKIESGRDLTPEISATEYDPVIRRSRPQGQADTTTGV